MSASKAPMIASRTRWTSAGSLAETSSAAGNSFDSSSRSVWATLSILLRTGIHGTSPAPISSSTSRVTCIWARKTGSAASTMCSSSDASSASSSVERELLDEAHRVRHQDARPTLGPQRTDGGVEGREQLVGDEHVRAGERAHQGRLARVGVPDQRDAQRLLTPRPSRLRLVFDGGQLRLELGDAVADLAAIELHGGLSRAPLPDAPALALAAAGLAQPGGQVGQPRDLDLQPRRSARRVPVEDLDDHARAIQDLRGGGRALDAAELARRQLVVDDDDGGARLPGGRGRRLELQRFGLVRLFPFLYVFLGSFLLTGRTFGDDARAAGPAGQLHQLALAEQRGSAEALALLRHLADDLEAERLAQAFELLQRRPLVGVGDARELHADEHRPGTRGFGGG